MRLAADVLGSCCLCARGHGMSVYANIIMPWTTSTVYTVQNGCCDYFTKFAPRSCFSSHSSSSMHSAAKQRSCGSESSLSQQKGAKKNPLESISEGSPMTLRQWVFARYAILTTLQHSSLMDMLLRRHELAMACIARQLLDASSDDQVLTTNGGHAEGEDSRVCVSETSREGSASVRAHYAVQPGESFKGWLHRLRRELPQARSSKRVYVVASESTDEFDVQFATIPIPKSVKSGKKKSNKSLGNSLEPRTKRVLYEHGLPYTQFVAALGTQLLSPLQKWARRAAQSKDSQPSRQLSQTLLVESLLAIEAHSLAPLLLDESNTRSPTRQEVEDMVQTVIMSRGVDYSNDPDDQLRLSLLALHLARQKAKEKQCEPEEVEEE